MLNHEWVDSISEWAESHPMTQRAHRALPLAADWPTRRAFIPQGCDQQGRAVPTIKTADRREFAGLGQDRMPEEFDADDQSESADAEVFVYLLKGCAVVGFVMLCAWVMAGGLDGLADNCVMNGKVRVCVVDETRHGR